ncbi:hypothetical protein AKO1_014215 [Acrasis kona]|uniref:Uncharacterized protein n=1 Tax=Acrasis kona TaxID=1008807 RepID=A0AAW2Z2K0_9EUKA
MTEKTLRVLVLGNSGVGKTSFLEQLTNQPNKTTQPTIGCRVYVQMHKYNKTDCYVEYFDVGTNEGIDKRASSMFYESNYDAMIYVFDMCDHATLASFSNVKQTINNILSSRNAQQTTEFLPTTFQRPARRMTQNIPVLLVGNNSSIFYEYTSQLSASSAMLPTTITPEKKASKTTTLATSTMLLTKLFLFTFFVITKIFCMGDYYRVGNAQQNQHYLKVKSTVHQLQQEVRADYIEVDCNKQIPTMQREIVSNFIERVLSGPR